MPMLVRLVLKPSSTNALARLAQPHSARISVAESALNVLQSDRAFLVLTPFVAFECNQRSSCQHLKKRCMCFPITISENPIRFTTMCQRINMTQMLANAKPEVRPERLWKPARPALRDVVDWYHWDFSHAHHRRTRNGSEPADAAGIGRWSSANRARASLNSFLSLVFSASTASAMVLSNWVLGILHSTGLKPFAPKY